MDSLLRLIWLGLHDDSDPKESGQKYGKSIFDMDKNTVNSINSNQQVDDKFKIDGIKYSLDEKDLPSSRLQDTSNNSIGTSSLSHVCNLDPEKIKWLQQQDECIARLIHKCKPTKMIKYHIIWTSMALYIEKKTKWTKYFPSYYVS